MNIQQTQARPFTPNRLTAAPRNEAAPAGSQDLVEIGQSNREMMDSNSMGKAIGGMIGVGVGLAGGLAVGGIGGSMILNSMGHPVLGVVVGMLGVGLAGAAIGGYIGAR